MLRHLGISLSDYEIEGIEILFKCHAQAAVNNRNLSSEVFIGATAGSGNIIQSICSALLTTGGMHAPVVSARNILFYNSEERCIDSINKIIEAKWKVPGFGHSLYKDKVDPNFEEIWQWLLETPMGERIERAREAIPHKVFPNAAAFTAAVASFCKLPKLMEVWLFLAPRTSAWITMVK